jgi:hypothetical protein
MTESIGLVLDNMSPATAFSTCVVSFSSFITTEDSERNSDVLLVKLDFERNKLLLWENAVGILNEPYNDQIAVLQRGTAAFRQSERLLQRIIQLLFDGNELRSKYGLHVMDTILSDDLSVVSKSNLDVFRRRLIRFLAQNPKEAEQRKQRTWLGVKWVISDQHKFRGLINDVKDLVDELLMIPINFRLPLDADRLDKEMRIDIKLVEKADDLSLVEDACEDSYRAWSKYAASVRAESEIGAAERRTLEELSRNFQWNRTLYRDLETKRVPRFAGSTRTGMKRIFSGSLRWPVDGN